METLAIRKNDTTNILFFTFTTLTAVIGIPWYVMTQGVSTAEWLLTFFFVAATGLSITVGYHRLFAHRAFQAHPIVNFLCLFFGAASFEQSALEWTSQHRDHHRYVDTPKDPYNIKQGFWYAHIGWILFWEYPTDYSNVKDLAQDPMIANQKKYYKLWAIGSGVILPVLIGAMMGHALGAFLLAVVGRLTLVHHSTFSINSVCHMFGKATYDIEASARDHWLVAFLTNGEGYHNFHHRFASDYRNGIRWYQWDPSKWIIALLAKVGLAKKLYRTPQHMILAAETQAEHARVKRALSKQTNQEVESLLQTVQTRYTQLKNALYEWERWDKEYIKLREKLAESAHQVTEMKEKMLRHKAQFLEARKLWIEYINSHPLIPASAQIA